MEFDLIMAEKSLDNSATKSDKYISKHVVPPVQIGRSEHNTAKRKQAFDRLHELLNDAERDNLLGVVTVEVYFERGVIDRVRRRYDGSDKA
jgi:hypothetical protein